MNTLKEFDNKYYSNKIKYLIGVDEAGRGPLAGPVVAAAVIFERNTFIEGVNDSKQVNEKLRTILSDQIKEKAIAYAFGIVNQATIDRINILQASLKAMSKAVKALGIDAELILIDGNKSFVSPILTKTIVKGDSKSFSIAAASILAKVKRDEIMRKAALEFSNYRWEKNKGYGTREHIDAIKMYGYTSFHRKSFLKNILSSETQGELNK